jgi:DNA invertase Pin-like site-specific DNA recombinase
MDCHLVIQCGILICISGTEFILSKTQIGGKVIMQTVIFFNGLEQNSITDFNEQFRKMQEQNEHAKEKGYEVVDTIISQTKLPVTDILPYLKEKTKKEFNAIYFENKTNINKNNDEIIRLIDGALEQGISIITKENGNLTLEYQATVKFTKEKNSKKKSEDAFQSRINAVEEGKFSGGQTPFGYLVNNNDDFYVDENLKEIIQEIFSLYARGLRAKNICKYLGDIYGMKYDSRESYWKADRIFTYLTNSIYVGRPMVNRTTKDENGVTTMNPRSEWVISKKKFDELQIIDDETFNKVQQRFWNEDKDRPLKYRLTWEN